MRERHGIIRDVQDSPFTLRELRRSLAGQALALVCLVALFAFIGPFGTYDSLRLLGRIGYWALAMGANWLVCGGIMMVAIVTAGGASMRRRMLVTAAAAPVAAAPGTGVVLAAEALFRPGYADGISLPTIYLSVAVLMLAIGLAVVAVLEVRRRLTDGSAAAPAESEDEDRGTRPGPAPGVRFLDRLPERLGRDLIYLRTADHYVEAFTTAGSTLVLNSLRRRHRRARGRGRLAGAPFLLGRQPPCDGIGAPARPHDASPQRRPRGAGEPHLHRRRPRRRPGLNGALLSARRRRTRLRRSGGRP